MKQMFESCVIDIDDISGYRSSVIDFKETLKFYENFGGRAPGSIDFSVKGIVEFLRNELMSYPTSNGDGWGATEVDWFDADMKEAISENAKKSILHRLGKGDSIDDESINYLIENPKFFEKGEIELPASIKRLIEKKLLEKISRLTDPSALDELLAKYEGTCMFERRRFKFRKTLTKLETNLRKAIDSKKAELGRASSGGAGGAEVRHGVVFYLSPEEATKRMEVKGSEESAGSDGSGAVIRVPLGKDPIGKGGDGIVDADL